MTRNVPGTKKNVYFELTGSFGLIRGSPQNPKMNWEVRNKVFFFSVAILCYRHTIPTNSRVR